MIGWDMKIHSIHVNVTNGVTGWDVRYKQQWGVHMCVVTWLSFSFCLCTQHNIQNCYKPKSSQGRQPNLGITPATQAHAICHYEDTILTIINSWARGPGVVYKRHNRESSLNNTTLCESRNSNTGKTFKVFTITCITRFKIPEPPGVNRILKKKPAYYINLNKTIKEKDICFLNCFIHCWKESKKYWQFPSSVIKGQNRVVCKNFF